MLVLVSANIVSCQNESRTLYRIYENGKYGYIDSTGNVVIQPSYIFSSKFTDSGYATIITNLENYGDDSVVISYNVINTFNEICLDTAQNVYLSKKNIDWFNNIEKADTLIMQYRYGALEFNTAFLSNLLPNENRILYQSQGSQCFGYKDMRGNIKVEPKFKHAGNFNCGVAIVSDTAQADMLRLNKYTLIDINGEKITSEKYFQIEDFIENKSIATKVSFANDEIELEQVIMDNKGLILSAPLPCRLGNLFHFVGKNSRHLAVIELYDLNFFTFVDDNGENLTDFDNDGLINFQTETFSDVRPFSEGYCGAKLSLDNNEGWYFLNQNFELASTICFDSINYFSEGYVAVKEKSMSDFKRTKWGYLNSEFKQSIDYLYDECGAFKNGLAYFKKQGRITSIEGYINKSGNIIWQTTTSMSEWN